MRLRKFLCCLVALLLLSSMFHPLAEAFRAKQNTVERVPSSFLNVLEENLSKEFTDRVTTDLFSEEVFTDFSLQFDPRDSVTLEQGSYKQASNSAPTASRVSPSREISVKVGTTVTFTVRGDDVDGNLWGAEWYLNGGFEEAHYDMSGYSDEDSWSYTFNDALDYYVEVVVFDGDLAYSGPVDWVVHVTAEVDDALITSFIPPSRAFNPSDWTSSTVEIENVGTTMRTFRIGLSYQKPDGIWYDLPPKETVALSPGGKDTKVFDWQLPGDAPDGWYNAKATVWHGYDADNDVMIPPKFDEQVVLNAFSIEYVFDFRIEVTPSTLDILQGESATYSVTVIFLTGSPEPVTLSLSGQHSSMSYTFNPEEDTPTFTATLEISTSFSSPPRQYELTAIGTSASSIIRTFDFALTINGLTIFTDKRMSVVTMGPITVPLLTTLNTFSIYWVSQSNTVSVSEYRSAFLQHLGIDLVLEGYKDYPTTFALIIEYQQVNLLAYLNEHYGWALPSWLLSNIRGEYQSADGAMRFVIPIGFSVLNPSILLRVASIATDIYKALENCAKDPIAFIKALTNLTQDIIDLMKEYFNIGLYVYKGLLSTTGKHTIEMLINALSTAKSQLNLLKTVLIARKLVHFLRLLSTAIFWLRMGVDIILIGPGTLDLVKELIKVGASFFLAFLEQMWTDPRWWEDLILTSLRLVVRALDPPDIGIYASIYNATSGELLLGYDPISGQMITESSVGFMLNDNSSQGFVLFRSSSYNLAIAFVGEAPLSLPYTLSVVDQYTNETFGTSGWFTTGESASLSMTTTETTTDITNYLITQASASTRTPAQGQQVMVDISVTDSHGSPIAEAEVSLLINNATWVTSDNLGSGLYQVVIDTSDLLGLVSIAIYATYANMMGGYDAVILEVVDATAPIANAGSDITVEENVPITFDASASSDNVGIVNYTWTFNDVTTKTLTGEKPSYTFTTPGIYTITLNITDSAGNWAVDTMVVTVLDVTNPIANAGQDRKANLGTTVTFDASSSTDNVGIVSYKWDFGDGTTETGITPTHTYTNPGTYTVTLTVKDAAGNTATDTVTITVLSQPLDPFRLWILSLIAAIIAIAVAGAIWRRRR